MPRDRGRGRDAWSTYRQFNFNYHLNLPSPSPPLQSENGDIADITGSKYIASFNWLDRDGPTVLIPGSPPAWTPVDVPYCLREDKGNYVRDPNATRFPSHPLEPAVRAILFENDGLNTQNADLFACSSTLGSLLRFVRRIEKPFRFFVEVVGNTVFFDRHENSPTELIEGVKGYGHTFPEAYTTWDPDVKGSASHQRLLEYNFGGLDCILRFECGGYLKSKVPASINEPIKDITLPHEESNGFASILRNTNITASLGPGKKRSDVLEVETAGQKIAQEAVFDLKTRSIRRKNMNVLEDELPRYWVAQIPNFVLARHDTGVFNDIQVQDIRNDVKEWERQNQSHTKKLRWLLGKIITTAKGRGDGKLEVCCKSVEVLELREQESDEHNDLPVELRLQWLNSGRLNGGYSPGGQEPKGGAPLSRASVKSSADSDSDDGIKLDYTACSVDCGYCGRCSY